jgi:hypothetical protein
MKYGICNKCGDNPMECTCYEKEEKEIKKMEWISVKDRLPKNNMWVLVFMKGHISICMPMGHVSFTHWMLLPDPPDIELEK